MLKRTLILVILAINHMGCVFEYEDRYKVSNISEKGRVEAERLRKEFLHLEDLAVGQGHIAVHGRKVSFQLEVRYGEGTLVYNGVAHAILGLYPESGIHGPYIGPNQRGIRLGLNGMAIGGRRRITVDRSLVCTDLPDQVDPRAKCLLLGDSEIPERMVRKENLIVEANLTQACIPVKLETNIWYFGFNIDIRCREEDTPHRGASDPIWRFYG